MKKIVNDCKLFNQIDVKGKGLWTKYKSDILEQDIGQI